MGTSSLEVLYAVLLVSSLTLNGIAVAGALPLTQLFAPLRAPRQVLPALVLDLLVAPVLILLPARLLGLDAQTDTALVLMAASSTGPIGVVLVRIAGVDLRLGVSLVTLFGTANLVTIPVLTALLLPASVPLPLGPVTLSLSLLIVLPLAMGRAWARLPATARLGPQARSRRLAHLGRASTLLLTAAVLAAGAIDLDGVIRQLRGPITPLALLVFMAITAGSVLCGRTRDERLTLALVINARGVGVALALAGLHLGDATDTRAAILAFAGLMQLLAVVAAVVIGRATRPRDQRNT